MKKITAIAAASLIALSGAVFAAPQAAEQAPAPRHMKAPQKGELPRDLQNLDLSSKQKAQIQKILEANRPAERPEAAPEGRPEQAQMQQKFEAARAAEQKIISGKNFDEAAARQLINDRQAEMQQHMAERQQKMADMEIKRLKERHDIFQVLNSKQQKQWLENQSKHHQGKPVLRRQGRQAEK